MRRIQRGKCPSRSDGPPVRGEGGRCGCRAEAGGGAGLLQGLGERRADRGGVGAAIPMPCRGCAWALLRGGFCGEDVRRGATDPLRSAETALPPVSARLAIA